MAKIGVTYVAPEGDSEVVQIGGVKFFNGQAVKIDEDEQGTLLGKLRKNPHFRVKGDDAGANKAQPKSEDSKSDDKSLSQPLPLP